MKYFVLMLCVLAMLGMEPAQAQRRNRTTTQAPAQQDHSQYFSELRYRNIGPFRAGRSLACVGHPSQPMTFYFGAVGGGLWKTTDGGQNWAPIADSFLTSSSIGAIGLAPSDPNVLYVGTGEGDIRGNISPGDGLYKSTDAGKTWKHIGFREATFISRIVVHPHNPDVAWVAVLGRVFGESEHGGIYKTTDGGTSWQKVLYVDERTGGSWLSIDPNNPRVLFASMWECYRHPWELSSGGPGSGLYRSKDGGETWENISRNPGLPNGMLGKIGVSVSPVDGNRVYANIENKEAGGVFASDDGGDTWRRTSGDNNYRQRAWYYTHIYADPVMKDRVYVLNVQMWRSDDGGKNFENISTPHGDHHDLWINPEQNDIFIVSEDGSAAVTYNGGESFSDYDMPTSQFYHVIVDSQVPYHVYGAQQDWPTAAVPSRTAGWSIGKDEVYVVAGGESGYIAPDPLNPKVQYGGSYYGYLSRSDQEKQTDRNIMVWPDYQIGEAAGELKYRFQWTFPIVFSRHNPRRLYTCAQYVFVTEDEGQTWRRISDDLTRNDSTKLGKSGGPITSDNTSVEHYCTIFAFNESPIQEGVLWAGSDDGLVHVSRDGGGSWRNVTPQGLPKWATISIIEPSSFDAGTCYLAAHNFRLDDFTPYLYKTTDYGATWSRIDGGIPRTHFTHVVREDMNVKGLLYAGTEFGVYVSFDDGAHWESLQLNLPQTPVRDLVVHGSEKDLIIGSHGRSFWILDDLSPLHEIALSGSRLASEDAWLFRPSSTYLWPGPTGYVGSGLSSGVNAPTGLFTHYYLKEATEDTLTLTYLTLQGDTIRQYSNKVKPNGEAYRADTTFNKQGEGLPNGVLSSSAGHHQFIWDMYWEGPTVVPGVIIWNGSRNGPKLVPGDYQAVLSVGDMTYVQPFTVLPDPRLEMSQAQYEERFTLAQELAESIDETNQALLDLRKWRGQVNEALGKLKQHEDYDTLKTQAQPILDELGEVEKGITQTKNKAGQDILNFGVGLDNRLATLLNMVAGQDGRVTASMKAVAAELIAEADLLLVRLQQVKDEHIPAFNAEIAKRNPPAIDTSTEEE